MGTKEKFFNLKRMLFINLKFIHLKRIIKRACTGNEDVMLRCPGGGLTSFDIEKILGKKTKKIKLRTFN